MFPLVCLSATELVFSFNLTCPGSSQISNRRWSGASTQSASVDVTTKVVRPHTAHGARTTDVDGEVFSPQGTAGGGKEAAPVVAGARGVMRYS